jgi:hypothetical protein
MFVMNIHVNGVSALMPNKSYILQFSLKPREIIDEGYDAILFLHL